MPEWAFPSRMPVLDTNAGKVCIPLICLAAPLRLPLFAEMRAGDRDAFESGAVSCLYALTKLIQMPNCSSTGMARPSNCFTSCILAHLLAECVLLLYLLLELLLLLLLSTSHGVRMQ